MTPCFFFAVNLTDSAIAYTTRYIYHTRCSLRQTTSTQNIHFIALTWFDIDLVKETWTMPPMQNANTLNYTTTRDVVFVGTNNITTTATSNFFSDGDNPDVSLHIYLAIRAVLGIVIMTFNGLLLYCICHFRYLHTPTNTLVANLCIADFLGGCRQFFTIATAYHIGQRSWTKFCLVGEIINMFGVGGNMWIIFGIGLNSCLYICRPLYYHNWVTIGRVFKIMAILWTYIITSTTIILLKFNRLVVGMPCKLVIFIDPMVYNTLYIPQSICLITGFLTCYIVIALVAWQQKKRCAQQIAPAESPTVNAAASTSTTSAADWKIIKMMALVPGAYLLSTFPAAVFGFVNNRIGRETMVHLDRAAAILWYTQCWANPLIYAWKDANFRRAIKTVLQIHNQTEPDNAWIGTTGIVPV